MDDCIGANILYWPYCLGPSHLAGLIQNDCKHVWRNCVWVILNQPCHIPSPQALNSPKLRTSPSPRSKIRTSKPNAPRHGTPAGWQWWCDGLMDHRTNRRQFREICRGWFLGLWWWLWWLWWWLLYILQIDSNRMFSGFIGDCKIFYCKSKFHVQKYDSTFSFVVSFQYTSIKVVCTVSKFPSCSRQPATVACWSLWKFGPIDWLIGWSTKVALHVFEPI